jgi:hypothetical protein
MKRYLASGLLVAAVVSLIGAPVLAGVITKPAIDKAGVDTPKSPFQPQTVKPPAATPPDSGETLPPGTARKSAQPPAEARIIRGKLTPPDRVKEAFLWERSRDLKIPVKIDPQTGAFEVTGLKMGSYDFLIRTPWGRLEGVDMAPKVSEYDILIPPEYRTPDLGLDEPGTLSDDDKQDVHRIIYEVKRYENKIRDLYLNGSPGKAVTLMELAMTGDFVGRKGDEITWRIEQWYYEKNYGGWTTFRVRCLYRFRISKAVWDTWGWQFEPALGGFDIRQDSKAPITVEYTIPEKPVAEKGLVGNQYPPAEKGIPKEPHPPEEEK